MTITIDMKPETDQPRAIGRAAVSVKPVPPRTVLKDLQQSGSLKALFPRTDQDELTAVLLNTAGGVTGGDRFAVSMTCAPDCALAVTTQASERAYRAQPGEIGRIDTTLTINGNGRLNWLPQETLLYHGAALHRRTRIEMDAASRLLWIEPIIFGRRAMGETVRDLRFRDHIDLYRDGELVFSDRTRITGNAAEILGKMATGNGATAMVSLICAAPGAEQYLDAARRLLPETGGVTIPCRDLVHARLLAPDGFDLRRMLFPLLHVFRDAPLPRTWMI